MGDEEVEPAVAIEVEESDTAAHRLNQPEPPIGRIEVRDRQAGLGGHVAEGGNAVAAAAVAWTGCSIEAERGVEAGEAAGRAPVAATDAPGRQTKRRRARPTSTSTKTDAMSLKSSRLTIYPAPGVIPGSRPRLA